MELTAFFLVPSSWEKLKALPGQSSRLLEPERCDWQVTLKECISTEEEGERKEAGFISENRNLHACETWRSRGEPKEEPNVPSLSTSERERREAKSLVSGVHLSQWSPASFLF